MMKHDYKKTQDPDRLLAIILNTAIPGILNGDYSQGTSLDYKRIFAFLSAKMPAEARDVLKPFRGSSLASHFNWDEETWSIIFNKPYTLNIANYLITRSLVNIGVELETTRDNEPENKVANLSPEPVADNRKPYVPIAKWKRIEDFLNANFCFRNNLVAHQIEYKDIDKEEYGELNENNLHRFLQLANEKFSLSNLKSLLQSDFVPNYDPFLGYFESLPEWDSQTDYIDQWANYVKAKDQEAFNRHFKKMLVRCVACALKGLYYNKQAFILVGHKQNTGKSTWVRALCPSALRHYISENMSTDKDALMCLAENFIINLDELAILDKKEINYIKSLLSKDRVKVRRPFDTRGTTDSRRASFFGSTNNEDFLTDETGSVRWLCFEIEGIDFSYTENCSIDQVWSQAYSLYKAGFKCELTSEEVKENEDRNKRFQRLSLESQLIQKCFMAGTQDCHDTFYTSTDILNDISEKYPAIRSQLKVGNIGKAMVSLGFTRESERKEGQRNPVYGYYVKFNKS